MLAAEVSEQAAVMTNLTVTDATASRFKGDFQVTPVAGYTPTAEEQSYLETLQRVLTALAEDEAEDPTAAAASARIIALREQRGETAAELRSEAHQFSSGSLAPEIAADNALVIKGKYVAARHRLSESLFVVREKVGAEGRAEDLIITVSSDANSAPPQEKQELFVAITNAFTVVKTVCQRIDDRANRGLRKRLMPRRADTERLRAGRLLDEYVRKLAGIGRLGLEGPHPQLARLALDSLRSEFVAQEAGRIKNGYVRSLGIAAGITALVFFGIYYWVWWVWGHELGPTASFWASNRAFLLAAGGAAVGTWLSFSIRRVKLSFEDLAILEEDLLDPSVRVIFVVSLAITACLLFVTKAMQIEIGGLKTSEFFGATALLIGILFGISERALATAISGRAATFVKGIAGVG